MKFLNMIALFLAVLGLAMTRRRRRSREEVACGGSDAVKCATEDAGRCCDTDSDKENGGFCKAECEEGQEELTEFSFVAAGRRRRRRY